MANTELKHVRITHAELAYPCWRPMKRSLLPPGKSVDDPDLATASALAAEIYAALLPNGSGVFLIRGPKKTGKSSTPKLLAANHLPPDTLIVEQLNPTTPGHLLDSIIEIRDQHDPDAKAPLLVILEEATWLRRIANQDPTGPAPTNACHATLRTEVTCKDDWTPWPEAAVKIPNCIVVITCNFDDEVRAEFEVLQDGAMLREERITAEFVMLPAGEGGYRRHVPNSWVGETKLTTPPEFGETMQRNDSIRTCDSADELREPLLLRA